MKIKKVEVKNFRILEDVTIDLDDKVTLIVGRNNSGKTSLTEVFNNFFSSGERIKFKFDDFSLSTHDKFIEAIKFYEDYIVSVENNESEEIIFKKEDKYKEILPKIVANIFIEYDDSDDGQLASLSNFLMDLDDNRKDALISCEFGLFEPEKALKTFKMNQGDYKDIIDFLQKNFYLFERKFFAVDKDEQTYRSLIEKVSDIENVFLPRFIHAQTVLDDKSDDNSKGLSKGFENFYKYNKEKDVSAENLKKSLENTSVTLDSEYKIFFKSLFNDLKCFGVNSGVNIQGIEIKSHFDVERVLKDNANLFYDHDTKLLPEKSNGLGYSKLIFIVLTILTYYEEQSKRKTTPNFSLLFIEEPEAHLHPQMQQTFIKNINEFIKNKDWNAQVIITTHSSHVVADCSFECIRYFDNSDRIKINVKNLTDFKSKINVDVLSFLKQYLTIHNCDMLFADKIIMVEGTVERLLLPEMIRKEAKGLANQYLSIIEVGGAYAHLFKEFLQFICVKTLIITDIDCIDTKNNRKSCAVTIGDNYLSSNRTLVTWIPAMENIKELLECEESKKCIDKIRITYQIPDNEKCGRSFEEAFILKNADIFATNTVDISTKKLFTKIEDGKERNKLKEEIFNESFEISKDIPKKTDFAFDIILLKNWSVPKYIKEGLQWLEK